MINADFVYTSANDGTCLIRPLTAKAETFWKENNLISKVIDNNEDYYIIKAVDGPDICSKIRESGMNFSN